MSKLALAALILESKTMEFDFPGYDGFSVELTYTTAEKYAELRNECMVTKLDKLTGYPVQELDLDKWNEVFCKQIITSWTGLKYSYLASMMLLNEDLIEDMDAEVEYDTDNAQLLLKHSKAFDTWVKERMSDLNNFRD